MGMPVTSSESLLKLPQEIRKVRPTILLAPPRMWERIYSTICTELRKRPAAARQAFYAGLALGLAAGRPSPPRGPPPGVLCRTGAGTGGGALSPGRQARALAHPRPAGGSRPGSFP